MDETDPLDARHFQAGIPPADLAEILSYQFLRRVIATIAIALPIVLIGAATIDGDPIRASISAYYYSRFGAYFVGSMCALGVVFTSYHHHPRPAYVVDNVMSNIGGVLAVVVALVPTSSTPNPSGGSLVAEVVHLASALALFLILAYLSYFRFTLPRGSDDTSMSTSPTKQRENRVHRVCGWVIVIGLAVMAVANVAHAANWVPLLAESIAVIAFGVSWLVKSMPRPIAAILGAARR